jgi:hypothetical protein
MSDVVKTEAAVEPEDSQKKWDAERQKLDMERANFQRAKAEKEQLAGKVSVYEQKIADLEKQIKVNQSKVEIQELDPLRADVPDLVKQNQLLIQELNGLKRGYTELQLLASEFQRTERTRQEEVARQKQIEKICKPLDDEFGAKYRTKAVKMAEDAVNNGEEAAPASEIDAFFTLKKFYEKIKSEDSKPKQKESPIPTDNGNHAFSFLTSDIQEGSLQEVMAQIRKKRK